MDRLQATGRVGEVAVAKAAAPMIGAGSTSSPRLVSAAHEFEAQLMKELLKPLQHGDALTADADGNGEDSSGDALGEFASEALGKALSNGGGFGIASSIVQHLSAKGNQNGTVPVIGNLHSDTVMKTNK